tara:strand:- start:3173 stop:3460 length:288 start_codon:yes stop_codon:yes gene_type:complete
MIDLATAVLIYASILTTPTATVHAPFFPNGEGAQTDHHTVVVDMRRQQTMTTLIKVKNDFFVPSASNPNEMKQGILILDAVQGVLSRRTTTSEKK